MTMARWTGSVVAVMALACSGQQAESRPAGSTAAAQPRDTDRGGGANATAANAEAASQRPSSGAGTQSPHPTVTDPNDPRYEGKGDAQAGAVARPGLEGRPGVQKGADQGAGSASAAAAKGEVKELPEVTGRLSRVSTGEIEVKPDSGDAVKLKVNPQTLVGGREGALTSLHEGDEVRASYDEHGRDKVAVDVRPKGPGGAATGTTTDATSGASAPIKSEPSRTGDTTTGGSTGTSSSGNSTDR